MFQSQILEDPESWRQSWPPSGRPSTRSYTATPTACPRTSIGGHSEGAVVFFDFLGLVLIHYSELVGIIINLVTIVASIWTTVNKILHSYNYGVSKNVYIPCWSGTVVIFIWHHANHTCNFQVFLSLVSVILGLSSTELRLSLTMADLVWDIVTVIGTLLVGALCAGVRSIFHIYYFIYN